MIEIDLLKYHQQCTQKLAQIWYEVLGKIWLPDLPMQYIEKQLIGSWVCQDSLSLAHIAIKNNDVIGVASLQEHCGIRPDLTLWLVSCG